MGMSTELIFSAALKKDTPEVVIEALRYMIGETKEKPSNFPLPDERCEWLFKMSSYYFAVSRTVNKMWYNETIGNWVLSTRSNIKNYEGEIEAFWSGLSRT